MNTLCHTFLMIISCRFFMQILKLIWDIHVIMIKICLKCLRKLAPDRPKGGVIIWINPKTMIYRCHRLGKLWTYPNFRVKWIECIKKLEPLKLMVLNLTIIKKVLISIIKINQKMKHGLGLISRILKIERSNLKI